MKKPERLLDAIARGSVEEAAGVAQSQGHILTGTMFFVIRLLGQRRLL
jgi:hypothetical protein